MAGFQKMRGLKILSVSRTQITDAGLEELMKVRQLEKLDLSACHYLSKEAIAAFRDALPDCEVETLGNVTDCPAMWYEPK